MSLQKGDKAPAFKLISPERTEVTLEDYKGKNLVILFFPFAFTRVCTTELCGVRDNLSSYRDLNAEIIGVSVDSPFTLGKFREEQQLNYPLLSDFNKEMSKAYEAYYESFMLGMLGVSKRAAFVVDGNGIIQYAEVLENAGEVPDFDAIKNTLTEISA